MVARHIEPRIRLAASVRIFFPSSDPLPAASPIEPVAPVYPERRAGSNTFCLSVPVSYAFPWIPSSGIKSRKYNQNYIILDRIRLYYYWYLRAVFYRALSFCLPLVYREQIPRTLSTLSTRGPGGPRVGQKGTFFCRVSRCRCPPLFFLITMLLTLVSNMIVSPASSGRSYDIPWTRRSPPGAACTPGPVGAWTFALTGGYAVKMRIREQAARAPSRLSWKGKGVGAGM